MCIRDRAGNHQCGEKNRDDPPDRPQTLLFGSVRLGFCHRRFSSKQNSQRNDGGRQDKSYGLGRVVFHLSLIHIYLGVVELSVAIELVFNTNIDRLVFDVGHQSYVHKLLTGRRADFARLRQYGGISGFPKPEESNTDAFVAGHASRSVSIALGMARARTLLQENYEDVYKRQ